MSKISTGHAKKLIQNYIINNVGEKIDPNGTRAVWFSREAILTALNTPVQGTEPNGLRFYFGSYETYNPPFPPIFEIDQSKITLVIIPTTHKLDDEGEIIMHPYRKTEVLPYDLLENPEADPAYDSISAAANDSNFAAANDGQLCPPPRVII